jgi:DNA-binding transcriptional LysR family regulator
MPKLDPWERAIRRRLRLRDLNVFFTVVASGSLSQAARQLGMAAPSVSVIIAELEHAVGARLLDRSPRGVTLTRSGEALLTRGRAAFDELQQGMREIATLEDPTTGDVRIGCSESASAFVALVIERVTQLHPRMRFVVHQTSGTTTDFPDLRARQIDLVLSRRLSDSQGRVEPDLDVEFLFDDPFFAVVGSHSPWARRRKLLFTELAEARWILPPFDAVAGSLLTAAYVAHGLEPQPQCVTTFSIHLRHYLASRGDYIALLPRSVLQLSGECFGLKVLPLDLPLRPSPLSAVTLRGRSLTPAARVFFQAARDVAATFRTDKS